ncbi:dTDP-4-dehydrorhamnose reductase [Sphingobacterium alimentarium]|uniref:dTDP-4-dehydrorhamnose reductase n=1 Tax=Sphingobacterium alimentarium TaxID=797292 RepID=A0A4R3VUZ7_9SPHI|nr:dTDP-4-dehydrorhamnose reductase [Sphingobacterium alimentarium]TCV10488.1 dTDP-4-dehydrorhamnose reductase [Sphingobacterium alimentarium]
MKIVITGSNGQLGSELQEVLKSHSDKDCAFLDRCKLPLDEPAKIGEVLANLQPDVIIHAAAYTAVDKAESEEALANTVNHLASAEIAKYSAANMVKLIAISTDYVFDGTSSQALKEDAAVDPINIYGLSKLHGEEAIQRIDPNAIIIRTSWVYSTYGNNFVKTMIRLMSEREEISVINDQVGSPTYAHDLANAIVSIIESKDWKAGIYHYSNEGEISWFDFASAIKEIKQLDCKINAIPTTAYPTPAKRPKFSLLDKSKIKQDYYLHVPEWRASLELMLSKLN